MVIPQLWKKALEDARRDHERMEYQRIFADRHLAKMYYDGNGWRDYEKYMSDGLMGRKPDTKRQIPRSNNNLVARVIDRTSLVYMVPPIRRIDGEQDDRLDGLLPDVDTSMHYAERMLNLLNSIAVWSRWDGDHIEREVLLDYRVYFADNPLIPAAIAFPLSGVGEERLWMYLDANVWMRYEEGGSVKDGEEHDYGDIPITFIHTSRPRRSFWETSPALDLVDACREVNVLTMDATANVRFQSYGQPWTSGVSPDNDLQIGPEKLVRIDDPQGSFNFASPPNTQDSTNGTIRDRYRMIARNWHLPEDFVEGSSQPESGIAKRLRNQELNDERIGDVKRFRSAETAMFERERVIAEVHGGPSIKGEFSVDFREDETIESADERRSRFDWEKEHNFRTDADTLMELDPDRFTTREEAQRFIDANKKQNSSRSTQLTDLLAGNA